MVLDGDEGNVIQCDRCFKVHDHDHGGSELKYGLWREIFKGRQFVDPMNSDFCIECALEVTPIVRQLRDVDELKRFVNKLGRTINERKNKNDRKT